MPPLKPEVTVVDGRVWLFIGAAYQQLTADRTHDLIRKLQAAESVLRKAEKREKRKAMAA